ncbi:hypothetical protein [Bradyrhizobium sp.]|uniref:hypothetical protein n=1 Tax=Bradyrhizobium sp. TaxID=376 RepID=UPI003C55CE86
MKNVVRSIVTAAALAVASAAFAQSSNTAAPAAPASPPPAAQASPAPADTAAAGKRGACQTAAQEIKGQDRQDQMQLCMAQAHLDCLKQAIDRKVVGPQRRDFMKGCIGG